MNIVLVGFMGSGKTTVGRVLASRLGREFIDTDSVIEELVMPIPEIFDKHGEQAFRQLERLVVGLLLLTDDKVIATGGGILLNEKNVKDLRINGLLIHLRVSAETAAIRAADRPLMREGIQQARALLKQRERVYKQADVEVDAEQPVGKVVEEVMKKLSGRVCACITDAKQLKSVQADLMELRLDLMNEPDVEALVCGCSVPCIATDKQNPANLLKAIDAGAGFVDVDISSPALEEVRSHANGKCKVIVSHHDTERTPGKRELEKILRKQMQLGDVGKIVTTARTEKDCERVLSLLDSAGSFPLIAFCMGEKGRRSRLACVLRGSFLTYGFVDAPVAPGQLSVEQLNGVLL